MVNAIETFALTRAFGELVAVDQLTLSIPEGCVFGFLGPNGAGKTTTVRMLAALIAPTSGSAVVAGHHVGRDDTAIRQSVGILTETPGLYDRLTALQNLIFFGQLYQLSAKQAGSQAARYLRLLDLWNRRDSLVGGFSKGMRQKLAIARALLHEPPILFLDEPTSGLDPEAARIVLDFIKSLRANGRTIFLTTHNLADADELCDVVAIFRARLLRTGPPHSLRTDLFGQGTTIKVAGEALRWIPIIEALPFVQCVRAHEGLLTVTLDDPDQQNPRLVFALAQAGAPIQAVTPIDHSLEEVYLELIDTP